MHPAARTIVIIGGGFCGTVLAARLLQRPPAGVTALVLVEQSEEIGRGVAYRRGPYPCLLNVPAGRMSVDPMDPEQFVRFARRRDATVGAEDFLPRQLYGEYLQDVLDSAERAACDRIGLRRVHGRAYELYRRDAMGFFLVGVTGHRHIPADDVVLACGDPPPCPPAFLATVQNQEACVCDPFSDAALRSDTGTLLLVGTGLTMADIAVTAAALNPAVQIHAISRHGMLPATQSGLPLGTPAVDLLPHLAAAPHSARRLLSAFRSLVRELEGLGSDWRDAVAVTRPAIPDLWHDLPAIERRRFLRHLRTRWDVHRHRLPPAIAERLVALRNTGQLQIHAGVIEKVGNAIGPLRVRWRPRGSSGTEQLVVDRVINCTGPHQRLADTREPLLRSLLDSGVAVADPLGLGLRTARHGALVDRSGWGSDHLFYLGPMLRSQHWEATATGELRVHAHQLAKKLAESSTAAATASASVSGVQRFTADVRQ